MDHPAGVRDGLDNLFTAGTADFSPMIVIARNRPAPTVGGPPYADENSAATGCYQRCTAAAPGSRAWLWYILLASVRTTLNLSVGISGSQSSGLILACGRYNGVDETP